MVSAILSNSILQFAFIICVLYSIGDISVVLSDTTGLAIIQVYYQATGSKAWTTIFVLMLIIMIYFCATNILASVSRLTYAFARDRGLPFSDFFSTVCVSDHHVKSSIPLTQTSDPSKIEDTSKRTHSNLRRECNTGINQHRKRRGIQRHCVTLYNRHIPLIRPPNRILPTQETQWFED